VFWPQDPTIDMAIRALLLAFISMVWVILLVRLIGLRAFSKMTSYDFVMTVATGSLLAGAAQATSWISFAQALLAMAGLFITQYLIARLRRDSDKFENIIQNEPTLLMFNGKILNNALYRTRVARSDLMAKLREANALDFSKVQAVVLETTGDISVLHGTDKLDTRLLSNINGFSPENPPQNPPR